MNSVYKCNPTKFNLLQQTQFNYAIVLGEKANKFEVKKIGKFVQILVLQLLYKILLCMATTRNWSISGMLICNMYQYICHLVCIEFLVEIYCSSVVT